MDDAAYNRLVILGDPGLGKSTLLKYLALRWAHQPTRSLALLLELRRTINESGKINFLDYLERGAAQTLALPRIELDLHLRENDSLVLFDGLDEVVEGYRGDVVLRIIAFAREYPRARIVVTTRIHGYHPDSTHPAQFRDAQFQQFTLQDFDPAEVDQFIAIWHREAFQQLPERTRYEARLRKALEDSPAIQELSANPLLLTMMAVLNRVQDLPRDRGQLYERCAELLLKNWDLEKFEELKEKRQTQDIKDKLGPEQKMRILELVAEAMQHEPTGLAGNVIGEEKLKRIIEKQLTELGIPQAWSVAGDLIWMLRERNFMLAYLGDRKYAFVHRTFLEYFCARDLKYRLEKTTALPADQLKSYFRESWRRDEWHEVLCLLCGMIGVEYAAKCISTLLTQRDTAGGNKAILLAAKCLFEIREIGRVKDVRTEVKGALFALFRLNFVHDVAYSDSELQRIRSMALRELARGWKEEAWMMDWLKERALKDKIDSVRSTAVQELARGWRQDPGIATWLKEHTINDESESVRWTVIEELMRGWKQDPGMAAWVKERLKTWAVRDRHHYTRRRAIQMLAREWKKDAGMADWLKERAAEDEDIYVRWTVIEDLVRDWKEEPGLMSWLKERARHDVSREVRRAALRELGHGWKDDPEVAELIRQQC